MKAVLPDYRVRRSLKSKSLRLKVTREEGLCVVLPHGFDETRVPAILRQKRAWIADALKRVAETRRFLEPKPVTHLPDTVRLAALGETWAVIYRDDKAGSGLRLRTEDGKLVISGASLAREGVIRKLKGWLRVRVREGLFPMAEILAARHHLGLAKLLVKSQRTRWASCSSRRNLSLNTKMLFLSPELVRYVLIHELCHTLHMEHGKEFWRLVAA